MILILNDQTKTLCEQFIVRPTHALLITAPAGSGKATLARYLASRLLACSPQALDGHPYVLTITPINNAISIDDIRRLRQFVSLRVPSTQAIARVIMIMDADAMSTEAQNALLKLLEEPPADTVIILTSSYTDRLLPTIRSRVRHLPVAASSLAQLTSHFEDLGHTTTAITKAYHLSEGRIGLMHALLDEKTDHPLVAAIDQAKTLLAATQFERLSLVEQITKQKTDLALLLQALERVCHAALQAAGGKEQPAPLHHWHRALKAVIAAQDQLAQSASTKLLLTNLMLSL